MNIKHLGDLIKDEYGNYYDAIIESSGYNHKEITLVHAYMDAAFSRLVIDDFIVENDKQFIGKLPTEILKNRIELIQDGISPSKIIPMSEVMKEYDKITIWNVYEKYPNVMAKPSHSIYFQTVIEK